MTTPLEDVHREAYRARELDPKMNDGTVETAGLPMFSALGEIDPDTLESEEGVEEETDEAVAEDDDALYAEERTDELHDSNLDVLRPLAEEWDIEGASTLKKDDLIAAIVAAELADGPDEDESAQIAESLTGVDGSDTV